MAEDKRWWKRDKDPDSSKEDVEDLLNEAEAKRLQREEELAEAEHREKMAEFTDPAPSTMKESESGDGSPVEYIGQRLVLKQDNNGCFYVKGSIANIANINFLVDTGASYCSVNERTAQMLGLERGEQVETQTAAGPGIGYRTTLPNITIGQMSIKNVDALINPLRDDDDDCILGMTFLEDIDWKHQNGMLILNPEGESDGTKVYGTDHWLLEDPGYTVAAIVLALGLIATAFIGVATAGSSDEWAETEAEVLEYYPGYDWVEHE
ncbi:MAG TPA: TIGR02281 family clan AA aspartic protease, partial [Candidatus Poseidoniales archaeon]|nr:TIGR02281 family clan AA aspartic protease [Candidatus Poseidoniales archaeon]